MTAANGPGGWPAWALPLAFFGGLWAAGLVLQHFVRRRTARGGPPEPPSTKTAAALGYGFCGLFLAVGSVASFFMTVRPVYRAYRAETWPTTGGVVLDSRLDVSRGGKNGKTYRADIHYHYTADGRDYESNQYDSTGTRTHSSFGYAGMKAAVDAHPPGTRVLVHYDPRDPADAMLTTRLPSHVLTFGWVPLVFVGFGVGGMLVVRYGACRVDRPTR